MSNKSSRKILWRETVGGALVFALGLACLGFLVVNLSSDLSIWVLGREATGHVTEQWVERLGDQEEGELTFSYHVRYQFTTRRGTVITQASTLGVGEWSSLGEGSPVEVVYFPLIPSHARLADQRFIPVYACTYLPFAIVAWAGLRAGRYLLRQGVGRTEE